MIVERVDFAETEIATRPATDGLGMTPPNEAIPNSNKERHAVLEVTSDAPDLQRYVVAAVAGLTGPRRTPPPRASHMASTVALGS